MPRYTMTFSDEQRLDIASALVAEALLRGDGHYVVGQTSGPMLVPPFEAPDSRWFDPGPEYPKRYARAQDIISDRVLSGLFSWANDVFKAGITWVYPFVPHEVTVEDRGPRRQALVVARDGVPLDPDELDSQKKVEVA